MAYLDRSQVVTEGSQRQPCCCKADGPLPIQACQLSMLADAEGICCTQHLRKACSLCHVSHKLRSYIQQQVVFMFAYRRVSLHDQQSDPDLVTANMTQYKHDQSCTPVEDTENLTVHTSRCVHPLCHRSSKTQPSRINCVESKTRQDN